jgi:hypothetical protein
MKRTKLMITFLSAATFTVGCKKESTTSQQIDKIQAKTEEVSQGMKDYSYAQKTQFVEYMQGQLAALNADLEAARSQAQAPSGARALVGGNGFAARHLRILPRGGPVFWLINTH